MSLLRDSVLMSTPSFIRAFIAIAPDAPVLEGLQRLQRTLQAKSPAASVRWATRPQLHITLRFLGQVVSARTDELTRGLEEVCAGHGPFLLRAENLGCFPDARNPRVLWVGITGQLTELMALQEAVTKQTASWGDHTEERAFQPHLTIGRVKGGAREAWLIGEQVNAQCPFSLGEWRVKRVDLVQSILAPQGAAYVCLKSVPLTPQGES